MDRQVAIAWAVASSAVAFALVAVIGSSAGWFGGDAGEPVASTVEAQVARRGGAQQEGREARRRPRDEEGGERWEHEEDDEDEEHERGERGERDEEHERGERDDD